MTDVKSLQPLSHGNILLVGVKASNLSDEIRNHPRVVIWDSQHESWTHKDIPSNVRVVFTTRFLGHTPFAKIRNEAVKRHLTIFNPEGTGQITRQVKELLSMTLPAEFQVEYTKPEVQETKVTILNARQENGKLKPLIPYIDFSLGNMANARLLMSRAQEMNIITTLGSLSQLVVVQRRKQQATPVKSGRPTIEKKQTVKLDVSVEMLDGVIKELQDMRQFLISVTEENDRLRVKVDKFKRFFDE